MSYEYFEISPKILLVRKPTVISIRARYEKRSFRLLSRHGTLLLEGISETGLLEDGNVPGWAQYDQIPYELDDEGPLRFTATLAEEGEKTFRITQVQNGRKTVILTFSVYALEEDLFQLRPYRGDMHIHSACSECGNRDEDPLCVAAYACEAGLDYIALTDHAQLEPSVILQDSLFFYGLEFRTYYGEEVHFLPEHQDELFHNRFLPALHFVNFNGYASVVKYQNENFDQVEAIIESRASYMDPSLPESVRRLQAMSDWLQDTIHEFNGLVIFAHPFWRPENRNNLPDTVREYILKQNKFDAMEIIGLGAAPVHRESNQQCVSWWQRASMQRGKMIPVVGDTDSHNTRRDLNTRATIVFARENSFRALAEGIRGGKSVAGSFYPGEGPVLYGDYRYVDFAYYLCREFYPEHDAICKMIGGFLRSALRGTSTADEVRKVASGRMAALYSKYWAN